MSKIKKKSSRQAKSAILRAKKAESNYKQKQNMSAPDKKKPPSLQG